MGDADDTEINENEGRLYVCYYAIFGLQCFRTVHLDKWTSFERGHLHPGGNGPRIRTLQDFYNHFDHVQELFRNNNFIEEYARMYKDSETFRSNHVTTDQANYRLRCLYTAIYVEGVEYVKQQISNIVSAHSSAGLIHSGLVSRDILILIGDEKYTPRTSFDNSDSYFNTQPENDDAHQSRLFGDRKAKENTHPRDADHSASEEPARSRRRSSDRQQPGGPILSPRAQLPALLDNLKALSLQVGY
jgi:hypothetical protein